MRPVIFSNLGCLALSVGLPKHTVVLQHLCACTTPRVLLPPSLPFTHEEPVHWGTAKFTLHIVTAPRVGNRTQGGKEREVITSVGSSAKKWELCSGEVTLDWERGSPGQEEVQHCPWLELEGRSSPRAHRAGDGMVRAAVHQQQMAGKSWDGLWTTCCIPDLWHGGESLPRAKEEERSSLGSKGGALPPRQSQRRRDIRRQAPFLVTFPGAWKGEQREGMPT